MKLLIITAHPDDAEFMFGGIINKYIAKGHVVDILIITDGRSWNRLGITDSKEIIKIRQKESRNAGKILGIHDITFLDFEDGLVEKNELIPVLVEEIRKHNPNLILTHSEFEGHNDHKEVSMSVKRVCNQIGEPSPLLNPYWKSREAPLTDFQGLFTFHTFQEGVSATTRFISLEKTDIEKKIKAILCHKSQFTDDKVITERIMTEARFYGIVSGNTYSEVYDVIPSDLISTAPMLVN